MTMTQPLSFVTSFRFSLSAALKSNCRSRNLSITDCRCSSLGPVSYEKYPEKSAVSTALFRFGGPSVQVLLIKRGRAPNLGLWALPGGKVHPGEELLQAAERELEEETSIPASSTSFIPHSVHVVHIPVVSSNFIYRINVFAAKLLSNYDPVAGDDAAEAHFFDIEALSKLQAVPTLQAAVNAAYEAVSLRIVS